MTESEINDLQKKLQIADAATRIYVDKGSFTIHEIAKRTDLTVGEVFSYFSSKRAILNFFYTSLIIRYQLMIDEIEGFESFTIGEKLSNFVYASFDLMQERSEFVEQTFRSHILQRCEKTAYENKIEELLYNFIETDSARAASSDLVLNDIGISFLRKNYLLLVSFWLNDKSEGKEVSMELTDKLTGLTQEILHTSVVDRGVDLIKFIYSNDLLSQQCPLWQRISKSFEIK